MRWFLIYEDTIPLEITFEDVLKIRATYPDAPIIRESELKDYLEYRRIALIFG